MSTATSTYGMHVRFTAQAGQGDALAALLLEAAAGTQDLAECRLYLVSRDPEDGDVVFVTEAWTSRAAHDAALEDPATRALIGRAMPLLAGAPQATQLAPAGGKGA
jgi:quinol monooxygenase YgiN